VDCWLSIIELSKNYFEGKNIFIQGK